MATQMQQNLSDCLTLDDQLIDEYIAAANRLKGKRPNTEEFKQNWTSMMNEVEERKTRAKEGQMREAQHRRNQMDRDKLSRYQKEVQMEYATQESKMQPILTDEQLIRRDVSEFSQGLERALLSWCRNKQLPDSEEYAVTYLFRHIFDFVNHSVKLEDGVPINATNTILETPTFNKIESDTFWEAYHKVHQYVVNISKGRKDGQHADIRAFFTKLWKYIQHWDGINPNVLGRSSPEVETPQWLTMQLCHRFRLLAKKEHCNAISKLEGELCAYISSDHSQPITSFLTSVGQTECSLKSLEETLSAISDGLINRVQRSGTANPNDIVDGIHAVVSELQSLAKRFPDPNAGRHPKPYVMLSQYLSEAGQALPKEMNATERERFWTACNTLIDIYKAWVK